MRIEFGKKYTEALKKVKATAINMIYKMDHALIKNTINKPYAFVYILLIMLTLQLPFITMGYIINMIAATTLLISILLSYNSANKIVKMKRILVLQNKTWETVRSIEMKLKKIEMLEEQNNQGALSILNKIKHGGTK